MYIDLYINKRLIYLLNANINCLFLDTPVKYISKKQIEEFVVFSEIFKLKPVIALRFNRVGWLFVKPKDLKDSGKNFSITLKQAEKKGKKFAQFFN